MFRNAIIAATVLVACATPAAAQDINGRPTYGTVNLRGGFTPDPRVIRVQAGGSIDASRAVNGSCRGFIARAPDVRLNWVRGGLPLIISANSRADTTLVINGPDGRWYCDDDGGNGAFNPSVTFRGAQTGRYEIWVGTYRGGRLEPAQLHISEIRSQ